MPCLPWSLLLLLIALLASAPPAARATVILNDGLTHVVDDNRYASEYAFVEDASDGSPTRLVLAPGAVALQLGVWQHSRIEIAGGIVTDQIHQEGPATLDISAGNVRLVNASTGPVNLSGGNVDYLAVDYDTTTLTGGTVSQRFQVEGFATAQVYGGSIDGLMVILDVSTAFIHGSDFAIDSVPQPLGVTPAYEGNVTGYYLDGSPFSFNFARESSANLVFIPEPGTGLLVIAGLLGLARWRRAHA